MRTSLGQQDLNEDEQYASGLASNPEFGSGRLIRSWAMRRLSANRLEAVMEDQYHALAVAIGHDAEKITDLEACWYRQPLTSCSGAELLLKQAVGTLLSDDLMATGLWADARAHCTHMFDTCRLAIVHIAGNRPDRRYDVILPDIIEGRQPAYILVDGDRRLELELASDDTILRPENLAGVSIMRGFLRSAREVVAPEVMELLFMVQRTYVVARARRIDMPRYFGAPASIAGPPEGACYGSQPERYRTATRLGMDRPDLTLEQAVRFGFSGAGRDDRHGQ